MQKCKGSFIRTNFVNKLTENVMNEYETERPSKNLNSFKTETDVQNHGF